MTSEQNSADRPTFQFNFYGSVGQNVAHVDCMEVHFDKDMTMQVVDVGEGRCAVVSGESGEVAEAGLAATLAPIFFGNAEAASTFLESIRGAKPTQVTALVNQWVEERKISPLSCHRDLWSVLHEAGLYAPSESNWNQQVK